MRLNASCDTLSQAIDGAECSFSACGQCCRLHFSLCFIQTVRSSQVEAMLLLAGQRSAW